MSVTFFLVIALPVYLIRNRWRSSTNTELAPEEKPVGGQPSQLRLGFPAADGKAGEDRAPVLGRVSVVSGGARAAAGRRLGAGGGRRGGGARGAHTRGSRALRFPGSPTILVDGRDVDQAGADGEPSLSCRITGSRMAACHPSRAASNSRRPCMSLALGSEAPEFAPKGVDGALHSLADYGDEPCSRSSSRATIAPRPTCSRGRAGSARSRRTTQTTASFSSRSTRTIPSATWETRLPRWSAMRTRRASRSTTCTTLEQTVAHALGVGAHA